MNGSLWCIHIAGPDDLIAMPSKAIAEAVAANFNAMIATGPLKISASMQEWPSTPAAHGKNLVENFHDYAELVLPPAPVPGQFGLHFQPASIKPVAAHEDREFLLYNQCDGYHVAQAVFDDDGTFEAFREFGGPDVPEGAYQAWAVLPDCNDELYSLFARTGEES